MFTHMRAEPVTADTGAREQTLLSDCTGVRTGEASGSRPPHPIPPGGENSMALHRVPRTGPFTCACNAKVKNQENAGSFEGLKMA